jgi:ATP/maltotriose-dependent transcriptional regulator MalT
MQPLGYSLGVAGIALLLAAAAGFQVSQWILARRLAAARKELARVSDDVFQMAELQLELYRKVVRNINEVEEKVLELAIPCPDPSLPLERRHQVLTLSGKGMSPREIANRLKMPAGEVELILNVKGFVDARSTRSSAGNGVSKAHAGEKWGGLSGEMLA